jgi:outer membrane lipoprotein SlyB
MINVIKKLFLFALVFILVSCATNTPKEHSIPKVSLESLQPRSSGSADQVNRSISARVKSVRDVQVAGTTGVGGAAGAATGAVLGSTDGNSSFGHLVGAIGGAIIGGIAGADIQENVTKKTLLEYVVETENGNLMMIVQSNETIYAVGQKVLVIEGAPPRLTADPQVNR